MGKQASLTLPSGFSFNYENLFGKGRVTSEDIAGLDGRIKAAHRAIEHMRKTGEICGHLSKDGAPEKVLFSQLPYVAKGNLNSMESILRLKKFGETVRYRVDAIVSFGIGGSFLGNKVLFDVHCGEFWNSKSVEQRVGYPKMYFNGNNIDARRTVEMINQLDMDAEKKYLKKEGPYRVMLIVMSKSGATLDTMSTFMVAYQALKEKAPLIEIEVVAVTDPATGEKRTFLKQLADEQGWTTFAIPDGVGGRFSVFSEVGLLTAACIGLDIDKFLAGARAMDEACQTEDLWGNPALLNAVLKYLAAEKYGRDIEVFMPYADYLKSAAEWYVQLLAESLGKRYDREENEVFYGRTPIVAVGTTDMHAQTQQHQEGKKDKVVQFVKIADWGKEPVIPDVFPNASKLSEIAGIRLSQAMDVACESNAEALCSENRFNAAFILPKLNEYHLGELLYLLAW